MRSMRKLLEGELGCISLLLIIASVFALMFWTSYFSQLARSGSKLYFIVALIPVAIIIVVYIAAMLVPTIEYPGLEIPKEHSVANPAVSTSKKVPLPYVLEEAKVLFVTEKVSSEVIAENHWRIHLYFLLHNNHTEKVVLTDIHANLYYKLPVIQKGVVGRWEAIVLYETNSIVAGGKVHEIVAGGTLPVDLVLEVSRRVGYGGDEGSAISGPVFVLFGIFVDYFFAEPDNNYKRFRIPSDSVFIFQDSADGDLDYINKKNFSKFCEENKNSGRLLNLTRECLDKHTSQYYEIA
jgi:hypothetical protein